MNEWLVGVSVVSLKFSELFVFGLMFVFTFQQNSVVLCDLVGDCVRLKKGKSTKEKVWMEDGTANKLIEHIHFVG